MIMLRLQRVCKLYRSHGIRESFYRLGTSRCYSGLIQNKSSCLYRRHSVLLCSSGNTKIIRTTMADALLVFLNCTRSVTTAVNVSPSEAQMDSDFVPFSSGIVVEPYTPLPYISLKERLFTKNGRTRTKEELLSELKSAPVILKLWKRGMTKPKMYRDVVIMYKELYTAMMTGNRTLLKKLVTGEMYSELLDELKERESRTPTVYFEFDGPLLTLKNYQTRWIPMEGKDGEKEACVQMTFGFISLQKYEAYDPKGIAVDGDREKEYMVGDIWVLEKCIPADADVGWLLCRRIHHRSMENKEDPWIW